MGLASSIVKAAVAIGGTALAMTSASATDGALWRELASLGRSCDIRGTGAHVLTAEREIPVLLRRMLASPPERCDNIAAEARRRLQAAVGEVERPDVPLYLLPVLRDAAERGLGGPADPALAARADRMIWLLGRTQPGRPGPESATPEQEAERRAWLERPETIALLEAHVAHPQATRRAIRRLAELSLRRDLPSYDPQRAARLLDGPRRSPPADRALLVRLLSDGTQMPRNFARAANVLLPEYWFNAASVSDRAEMERLARRASASARNREQRLVALLCLWAASINAPEDFARDRDAMLRSIGDIPRAELSEGDARALAYAVNIHLSVFRNPGAVAPILVDGLIGPDGRLVMARFVRASGVEPFDREILAAYASWGREVDLSGSAQGRLVWVRLPPIVRT